MTTEPNKPVTVGELVDALSTYPRDALVFTWEAGTGNGSIGVEVRPHMVEVWDGTTSAGNWYDPENIPFDKRRPRPGRMHQWVIAQTFVGMRAHAHCSTCDATANDSGELPVYGCSPEPKHDRLQEGT